MSKIEPKTEVRDNVALMLFRLVEMHYGTLEEVKRFTAREVLQIFNFKEFFNYYNQILEDRIKNDFVE